MSQPEEPREPGGPRGIAAGWLVPLLVISLLQLFLLAGFLLGWLFPPPPCGRPILLDGSGSAYSDFHDDRATAIREARDRVQGKADSAAAAAVDAFQCASGCPSKTGTSATADITNVVPSYGPPGGPGTEEKWWARADFNWFANVVCQK